MKNLSKNKLWYILLVHQGVLQEITHYEYEKRT